MKNYYDDFIKLCHEDISDMTFSDYYNNVLKCYCLCFNCFNLSNIIEVNNSLDIVKEFYDKKRTIYDCSIEIGINYICG